MTPTSEQDISQPQRWCLIEEVGVSSRCSSETPLEAGTRGNLGRIPLLHMTPSLGPSPLTRSAVVTSVKKERRRTPLKKLAELVLCGCPFPEPLKNYRCYSRVQEQCFEFLSCSIHYLS